MSGLHPAQPQPQASDLDQLLANLILALASRRCSPTYSTAYHWNSHALLLLSRALQHQCTPAPTASVTALLHRLRTHALWFQDHYRHALEAFQRDRATEPVLAQRRQSAADFEAQLRPGMPSSPFAPMMAAQAERLEVELRAVWRSRVGPEASLGVGERRVQVLEEGRKKEEEEQQRPWEVRLAGPDGLGLRLEMELRGRERERAHRGVVVEGVDEDMLLRFWEANPGV